MTIDIYSLETSATRIRSRQLPSRMYRLRQRVAELIGGPQRQINTVYDTPKATPTRNYGPGTYSFWDRARRGQVANMQLGGLMLKPIFSKIAAWVIGETPSFRLDNKAQQERLNNWWQTHHPRILKAYEESVSLGDCFLVINADLSATVVPPDVVTPIVNENDFSQLLGWRIEQVYPHPTKPGQTMTIRDEYTADRRVKTIYKNGAQIKREEFRNLIGRVPVVHLPNYIFGADSLYGDSEALALVYLLYKYSEAMDNSLTGNKKQGRPTPTVERIGGPAEMQAFKEQYSKRRTITHPDGTTETETYFEFDSDKLMMLAGDATFNWKSPSSFMGDTRALLEILFYLYVDHIEVPEGFLGTAVPGSRASLDTQETPLVKFIEKKRTYITEPVLEVCRIVMGYHGVINPLDSAEDDPAIKWPRIASEDGALRLSVVQYGHGEGQLLDDETALSLLPVEIENPADVLKKAQEEAEQRREQAGQNVDQRIAEAERRAQQADDQSNADLNQNGGAPAAVPPPSARSANTGV